MEEQEGIFSKETNVMDSEEDDEVIMGDDDSEAVGEEIPKFTVKASYEAKIRELLCNVNSVEVKLCSDASKEFMRLLKGETGGELLHQYVRTSSKCSELLEAWKLRQGKPGVSYVLSLISAILSHPDGKYKPNDAGRIAISRVLDKFASLIIEEKLGDIYMELNTKEAKRQNAALLLMASIVRRGSGLASEVAKRFDFKLPMFPKLAEYRYKPTEKKRKHSTRKSFVQFAMSFLEVGKPGLLRWVLQQKEMYFGVLRGIGDDDDETIRHVLLTLQDRILTPESLVSPGQRSVLFGSVTLEQLAGISGREDGGQAAELAHKVLVVVCTDPRNGLMPDLKLHQNPLKGNPNRLFNLMKKLKAIEIGYHRDLLLAIINGMPSFGSAYMDEFPYNLEDHGSPSWFAAVSLAASLVSAVGRGLSFCFLGSQSHDLPSFNGLAVQSFLKCIFSRPLSRSVMNKGLLHSNFIVKHGTLRLLLESLKLLDSLIGAISRRFSSSNLPLQGWTSLKQEIQNESQTLLPDPQVLFKLLSSLNSPSRAHKFSLKRKADSEYISQSSSSSTLKKLKSDIINEDADIIIGGINLHPDIVLPGDGTADEFDDGNNHLNVIMEIWGLNESSMHVMAQKDAEIYFLSKLLDALKIYLRTMPDVLEGSFDFFVDLLSNPLSLPTNLLHSLLSLLIEYIGPSPRSEISMRTPPLMYKHLQHFVNLFLFTPSNDIRDQSYILARAAILSTGAFDRNLHEIGAWFLFLPCYGGNNSFVEEAQGIKEFQNLSIVVVSFLCDSISTIGNNLFKYWDIVRCYIYKSKGVKDVLPEFSPLVICALQKCLRLLKSESGTFTLPEKTIISLYVCNTLRYLLQTQVDPGLLSALINLILSGGLQDHCFMVDDDFGNVFCEWRPLKNLWLLSQSIERQQPCALFSLDTKATHLESSAANILCEVQKVLRSGYTDELAGIAKAFSSAIICMRLDEILRNFPAVICISENLLGVPFSLLLLVLSLQPSFLADVSKIWPEMFFPSLQMVLSMSDHEGRSSGACRSHGHPLSSNGVLSNIDFDPSQSSAVAFSHFLKLAPFHVLFPAIMRIDDQHILEPMKVHNLLLGKLSEKTTDYLVSSLRLVLFWFHQIQSSYRIKPSVELEQRSEICFVLLEHMLANLLVSTPDYDRSTSVGEAWSTQVEEVTRTVFYHPFIKLYLECPLGCNEDLRKGILGEDVEVFLALPTRNVYKIDQRALTVLATTSDYLLSLCKGDNSISMVDDNVKKQVVKAVKVVVQKLIEEFRNRFDLCTGTKDLIPLVPLVYAFFALIHSISPFELLELVCWVFSRIDLNDMTLVKSLKISALSVGFCIAGGAFKALSNYLTQPITHRVAYNLFWAKEKTLFDFSLFENIYCRVLNFAARLELESADLCLLKAVDVVFRQKYTEDQNLLSSSFGMLRVITSTTTEIVSHCIKRINRTKAQLLFRLTELSPLHLSVFGRSFSGILCGNMLSKDYLMKKTCTLSDEELMFLLPTVLTYLNATFRLFGRRYYKCFSSMPSVYSRVLLNGFLNWNSYVSQNIFQVECDEFLPSSSNEILKFVGHSLLGKAIQMLRYYFGFNGDSVKMKKRLKLFDSICPHSAVYGGLLDCDIGELGSYSLNQSLNLINRVVAKVNFCRILLFEENNHTICSLEEAQGMLKEIKLGIGSNQEDSSRLQFINILVSSWQLIVKKFPSSPSNSGKGNNSDCLCMFKFLEVFILRNIVELTPKLLNVLLQLQSISFIEQLTKSSLLYRLQDPTTLKMIRSILSLVSEGNFSRISILQLLLAHSQFAPTIQSLPKSSASHFGAFTRPMSSILRMFAIPSIHQTEIDSKNNLGSTELYAKQLEIVKLLNELFTSKANSCEFESEKDIIINSKELLLLLLSAYGATHSEIDREIYGLIRTIEFSCHLNPGYIAELDYLWGSSASKLRKELAEEQNILSSVMTDTEAIDRRRSQFRENLPVDPKLCLTTVLYFPYDRTSCEPFSANKIHSNMGNKLEVNSTDAENIQRYDPVFILRFSIHCLSMGFIEAVEFASLGLLAIAFVSISSPDNGIRQMGYETLGRFKDALKKCQKRKDVIQLRLLLSYMQNGIDEAWQKIPSVIAIFAAEASLVLLDPSNDHYSAISKLLMHSSRVNIKSIPLFHNFLWSSSVNFKKERLWILRLSYAGLNLEDDAQIYVRNSIMEILLSFYTSPLSDNESRDLILQILKKAVKLHKMARHLVENCGLVAWLSSIVSFLSERLGEINQSSFPTLLAVVLEVVSDVISSRNIIEWLQKYALEQLMELSCHLFKLLVGGLKLMKENVASVNSILQILASTMRISQKRKIYQPHFTLSVEGLFEIYEAVNVYSNRRSGHFAGFGLKAILMSTPPAAIFQMHREKLLEFLLWATNTSLMSDATEMLQPKESVHLKIFWEEEQHEESLTEKMLRWLTASVILGKLSWNANNMKSEVSKKSELKNLQSLLERCQKEGGGNHRSSPGCEEILASTIFYLQQLLGMDCSVLSSVVSALCLLLLPDGSNPAGSGSNFMLGCGNHVGLLLSRIFCPAEANPAWRWSYFQPWKDLSVELTDVEKMDELHACRALLVLISNMLGKKSPESQVLSLKEVENSGVFEFEKNILEIE